MRLLQLVSGWKQLRWQKKRDGKDRREEEGMRGVCVWVVSKAREKLDGSGGCGVERPCAEVEAASTSERAEVAEEGSARVAE